MELNGIPLSPISANLYYLPISHLMKHTLLACPLEDVPEVYRAEYASRIIRGPMMKFETFGILMVKREQSIWASDVAA